MPFKAPKSLLFFESTLSRSCGLSQDDDILVWGSVARAFEVEEERLNLRLRMGPLGQATSSSSSSQHAPHDGDEDDGGYKSCDDNDDGPLLNENDDYVRF